MNKLDRVILYITAFVSIVILFLPSASGVLGGATNYDSVDTTDGYAVDGTTVIDGSGNFDGAVTTGANNLTVGSSGTSIDTYTCTTATWDPPAFSSTTVASTSIPLVGADLGDSLIVSFDAATSSAQWYVKGNIGPAGSSTIFLVAARSTVAGDAYNTALNLTTSTIRACFFSY